MSCKNITKKYIVYFILLILGGYPTMPAYSGWFKRTPSCEKNAEKLLSSGYLYHSRLTLASDDDQHLAVFVEFYKRKKVKGNFYERVDNTIKLFRYQRTGKKFSLVSEQGSCGKFFDLEHDRAVMDGDRNIYFYYRKDNSFSLWPGTSQLKVQFYPVLGAQLSSSNISIDRKSGLIYATEKKRIVRQRKRGDFTFVKWLRFDDLVETDYSWNPFSILVSENKFWVCMVIFGGPNQSIANNKIEFWQFDMQGKLINKQNSDSTYHKFSPGSAVMGLRVDYTSDLPFTVLGYVDSSTGQAKEVLRTHGEKSDVSLRASDISKSGTLYSVYNLYVDEEHGVLHLVEYTPSLGSTETLLPLLIK